MYNTVLISIDADSFSLFFVTAHKGVAQKRAIKLAQTLGCHNSNSWKKTMKCLRQASAANITAAFYDYFVSHLE